MWQISWIKLLTVAFLFLSTSASPSEYADDMGSILLEQINEGLTDDQIYTFWVSRYGERIITNPINRNLEILFIPLILVVGFVLLFVRKLYVKK